MNSVFSLFTCALLLSIASTFADEVEGSKIASSAREQVGKTISYDPSYQSLSYPGGDVPIEGGVCTDVIIRALRTSLGFDLQKVVHEDMKANFSKYPKTWGLARPDKNIDHRRVLNLKTYFKRKGYELEESDDPSDYKPGDLVTCTVPPHLPHIMIVSDRLNEAGVPLIIHNIGSGAREEDRLFAFEITGRYRLKDLKKEDASSDDASRGSGE